MLNETGCSLCFPFGLKVGACLPVLISGWAMDLPPLASLSVVFSLWVRIMQLYVQVFTVNYRSLLFLSNCARRSLRKPESTCSRPLPQRNSRHAFMPRCPLFPSSVRVRALRSTMFSLQHNGFRSHNILYSNVIGAGLLIKTAN